jgi:hypothetical protein
LIGCSIDFGIELSVSVPKSKAKDLVLAYQSGIRSESKQRTTRKKKVAIKKRKVNNKSVKNKSVKKRASKTSKKAKKGK